MRALPNAASIRVLAVDLDGTLLTRDKRVTGETLRALSDFRARGVRLVVATARTERGCEDITALLSPDAVVTCSGALARAGEALVFGRPLSAAGANRIIAACKTAGAKVSALTEDWAYRVNYPKVHDYSVETDFDAPLAVGAYHVTAYLPDPARAEEIAAAAGAEVLRFSDSAWVRFGHPEACKECALAALLAYWGMEAEQMLAFGDDAVDIGMLRLAGCGVAMGNATPPVKAAADFVTLTNDEDGVADFVRRVL